MSTARFGRGHRAMALVPLALLSVAWTASVAGVGASTAVASAEPTSTPTTTLPDGSTVPTQALEAPASVSTAGGVAPGVKGKGDRIVSTVSTSAIPAAALAAYQRAETVINAADKSCNLSWQLIAAIGRVESDHGRTNGNTLDDKGVAQPGIIGVALDGTKGTSRILDTDAGQYDGDTKFDRAIGPMQFIPSTWAVIGVDADGDGERNPQDIDDAALGTAVYLCSGNDDLSTTAGQRGAVYRYNHSSSYVNLVLSIMRSYLEGDFTEAPNGTTSAGYLVPATPPKPAKGPKKGPSQQQQPHATQTTSPQAPAQPTQQPTPQPSQPAAPSAPAGGGGGGGGGVKLPSPSLPPLPSTSVAPVDALLSHAQAVVQCTLEGYVDNILKKDDPFDKCVYNYTH